MTRFSSTTGGTCHSTGPLLTEVAHSRDFPAVAVSRDLPAMEVSRANSAMEHSRVLPAMEDSRADLAIDFVSRDLPAIAVSRADPAMEHSRDSPAIEVSRADPEIENLVIIQRETGTPEMTVTSPPAGGSVPSSTEPVITEQDLQTHDEHPPEPKSGGEQIETITTTHSPEAMRASSHPRQRGAGRRRGKLVGGSGEPGELPGSSASQV